MPREREGFREQLEDIASFFGNRRLLSVQDVINYTGRDRDYVIKRFNISTPKDGITTVQLARKMVS